MLALFRLTDLPQFRRPIDRRREEVRQRRRGRGIERGECERRDLGDTVRTWELRIDEIPTDQLLSLLSGRL